jgi:hypothetical protein
MYITHIKFLLFFCDGESAGFILGVSDWIAPTFPSILLLCSSVGDVCRGSMYGGLATPCLLVGDTCPAEKPSHKHARSSDSETLLAD